MATGGCEQTSDEIFNFKCTPCAKTDRRREAVKYCVECQGYCCQSCVDTHKVFPALAAHRLLDKSNFKSTVLTTDLPSIPTEICNVHEVKIMDMYCGNHDVVGCTSCMTVDHRSCTDVQPISNVVDTIFKRSDADETHVKLQEKKNAVEKMKTSGEILLEELNQSKTEAIEAIINYRKEMETILQNLERESIQELEKEFQRLKSVLEDAMKKSEKVIGSIKRATDDLKQSDGNKAQQFVSMKTAQKKIAETDDILQSLEIPVHAKVSFSANTGIRTFLQQQKDLGSIIRETVYAVTRTRELNIRMQNDTSTCAVYGSSLTEDGKLLVADYNNKKLKRADIGKMSVVDYCDLSCKPWSVCCSGKNEAVVSLYNSSIQFVSLGNQMTPARELKLSHICWGIACKNEKLYITDNSKSLYIHDMTGNLLQTVSRDNSGKEMFTYCRNIAFSDVGDKVFVADYGNKLVTLDVEGKHISSLIDSDVNNGTGVCTDSRGNMFVCGYASQNVVQLSQNGTKMGVVVKTLDRLEGAWSLAFDPQHGTLCVTKSNSETVNIFDLLVKCLNRDSA